MEWIKWIERIKINKFCVSSRRILMIKRNNKIFQLNQILLCTWKHEHEHDDHTIWIGVIVMYASILRIYLLFQFEMTNKLFHIINMSDLHSCVHKFVASLNYIHLLCAFFFILILFLLLFMRSQYLLTPIHYIYYIS